MPVTVLSAICECRKEAEEDMLGFITENIGTIIVSAVLLIIVFFVVRSMIVAKKKGKTTCGCGCENCAMRGSCHGK